MQKGGARLQTTRHWQETSLGLLTLSSPSGACPLSRWPCISRYDDTYRIPSSIHHLRCPGSLKRHLNNASPAWPGPWAANQEPPVCHNSGHTRRVLDTCDQHEASHGSRTRPPSLQPVLFCVQHAWPVVLLLFCLRVRRRLGGMRVCCGRAVCSMTSTDCGTPSPTALLAHMPSKAGSARISCRRGRRQHRTKPCTRSRSSLPQHSQRHRQ